MPHTHTHIRKPLLPGSALIALLACLGLAACGGSSSTSKSTMSTSTSTNANAAKTSTTPGHPQAARRRFGSPAFRAALTAFAACMRSNGVKLSAPDTSGTGPVFSTKGVNTASAAFKAASAKCQSVLRSAFPRSPRRAG